MSEFRITVSLADLGRAEVAEKNAEQLLDSFLERHPEIGPIVSVDLERELLEVTVALDAEDAEAAFDEGRKFITSGFINSGVELTKVVSVNVELVDVQDRELAPA
jgi:hypothetical protein